MAELEIAGPADHAGVVICRMACLEKGVPHVYREALSAEWDDAAGGPPWLRHGKVRLFGVRGITTYIDRRFNGRELMPKDPIRAAEAEQWFCAILSRLDQIMSCNARSCTSLTGSSAHKCLAALNETIGSGYWIVGRGFTLADIALMPAVERLCRHTSHDEVRQHYPAISCWYSKHTSRKSWKSLGSQANGNLDG